MDYRLLGPLEISGETESVRLVGIRLPALVATLLLHANQHVSVERLARGVWREPPHAVASNIRTYVAQFREALAAAGESPARVTTEPGGYRLAVRADELDLTAFDRLAQAGEHALRGGDADAAADMLGRALRLWRGEALAGLTGSALLRAEATRLEERRLVVTRSWADAALAAGRTADAAAELSGLVDTQPLDEHAWALLMLALYRSGRQGEALAAYQDAYRVLDAELGVAPGRPLRSLHQRILAGDPALDAATVPGILTVPRGPTVRAPADRAPADRAPHGRAADSGAPRLPTPRQLPPDVIDFTGRAPQLGRLDGLLAAGPATRRAVPLSVLCGPAGVGKTALAVHWAHRVADQFPDGQLYLDLHGYAPVAPLAPVDALSGVLRALGVTAECVPPTPEECSALYRSLLAGRRTLVLLDNAASAEQVRPLLPGDRGCAVLVTSRDRLVGLVASHGARRLDLEVLTPAEAVALLAAAIGDERVRAEPAAAADLTALCEYLPLAVRIAAARLVDHRGAAIAAYAAELAAGDRLRVLQLDEDPRTGVAGAFELSYERLSEPARRLFRLLGLLDGPDVDAATATALAAEADAATELRTLVRAHLLQTDGAGRYHLHDLIRLYARDRAQVEESARQRLAAIHRVARHQLGLAQRARQILYPAMPVETDEQPVPDADGVLGPGSPEEALRWFGLERRNLVALAGALAEPGSVALAAQLLLTMQRFVHTHGYGDDWLALVARVRRATLADGEERLAALLAVCSAWERSEREDLDGAAAGYAEAAEAFSQLGDPALELTARVNHAVIRHQLGHPREAARAYAAALRIARRIGNRRVEAYALANLAAARRDIGQYRLGIRYAAWARDLFHAIDDWQGEAEAIDTLAQTYRCTGETDAAISAHRAALTLVDGRDQRRAAEIRRGLGSALAASGDLATAAATLRAAVRAFIELGAPEAGAVRRELAAIERRQLPPTRRTRR